MTPDQELLAKAVGQAIRMTTERLSPKHTAWDATAMEWMSDASEAHRLLGGRPGLFEEEFVDAVANAIIGK